MLYFLLDPLGTVALQHSNMSVVRATFTNVMDAVLDKLLPTTDDGRNNTLLYLLDSNGFIVWMSDSEQLQMSGQRFNKFQPLVFDDMVNKSVFIVGTFMGYEPKPCEAYGMPHSVTTACLDSAASSMHKVCLLITNCDSFFGIIIIIIVELLPFFN